MKTAEHCPKEMIGKKYRHFKGGLYVVLEIALHTETETLMVIYKSLDNPSHVFARPLHMFLSKVDKKKYPDITQELRFEEVSMLSDLAYPSVAQSSQEQNTTDWKESVMRTFTNTEESNYG